MAAWRAQQASRCISTHTWWLSPILETPLGGTITVGQAATGQYTYDTGVADSNPSDPQYGTYVQLPSHASTTITVGSTTFRSDPASPYPLPERAIATPSRHEPHPMEYPACRWHCVDPNGGLAVDPVEVLGPVIAGS